jgi:hypothetical protein
MMRSRFQTQRTPPTTSSGVGVVLAGIDHAADHHPERVVVRVGRVVDRRIVDLEQKETVLRIEQDQSRRRALDHRRGVVHLAFSSLAASTAP